jgi:hypothetical protein
MHRLKPLALGFVFFSLTHHRLSPTNAHVNI